RPAYIRHYISARGLAVCVPASGPVSMFRMRCGCYIDINTGIPRLASSGPEATSVAFEDEGPGRWGSGLRCARNRWAPCRNVPRMRPVEPVHRSSGRNDPNNVPCQACRKLKSAGPGLAYRCSTRLQRDEEGLGRGAGLISLQERVLGFLIDLRW